MRTDRSRVTRPGARIAAMRPGAPLEARPLRPSPRLLRRARAVRRGVLILLWTLPAAAVQAVCLLLPGRPKVVFARLYWAGVCRLLGMQVRVIGEAPPGGRAVVFASNHCSWLDIPVLGICYGAQLLAQQGGGEVLPATIREYGRARLSHLDEASPLLAGLHLDTQVWMSHGDTIKTLPADYEVLASTPEVAVAADEPRGVLGAGVRDICDEVGVAAGGPPGCAQAATPSSSVAAKATLPIAFDVMWTMCPPSPSYSPAESSRDGVGLN